jgi:predicted peptidase
MIALRRLYITFCFLTFFETACKKSEIIIHEQAEDRIEKTAYQLEPVRKGIGEMIGGYYQALPAHYGQWGLKYPLLIFFHGAGQFGNGANDLPILLNEGVTQLLDEKTFPPNFTLGKENFSFVILAPQFKNFPQPASIKQFLDYAFQAYKIDSSRVYLAGLSFGGRMVCDFVAAYPSECSAFVAMSGVSADDNYTADKCRRIASHNIPAWIFHNENDEVISEKDAMNFVELLNENHPSISPRLTIFPPEGLANHDSWSRATNPDYKENGMNIYEWMLQYTKH